MELVRSRMFGRGLLEDTSTRGCADCCGRSGVSKFLRLTRLEGFLGRSVERSSTSYQKLHPMDDEELRDEECCTKAYQRQL
jgi:hypothetical protein